MISKIMLGLRLKNYELVIVVIIITNNMALLHDVCFDLVEF